MKRLFSSTDSGQVGLIRSLLASADIPFEVRNEASSQLVPGWAFREELWVRDEDYEDAARLVAESRPA
jgi:hypothetical protein